MVSYQAPLFLLDDDNEPEQDVMAPDSIVNVASVPQRSPFRYPGGKTWLIPRVRRWLASMPARPAMLIEPFTGGGIVSLTVAFERLAERVMMVELDDDVAAVWATILNEDGEWLANRIAHFSVTHQTVRDVLGQTYCETRERAFATILKNRVNRGGILAPGASMVKNGENGRGLTSRWYPRTLYRRIMDITAVRDRIEFVHGDGIAVMCEHAHCPDVAYFIDPPYTAGGKRAGSRLYAHSIIDHEELFRVTATLAGDFLMTYDDADELHDLARRYGFDTLLVPMKNTHHARMTELLIGRDLDWARRLH